MLKPVIKNGKILKSLVIKICDSCGKELVTDTYTAKTQRKHRSHNNDKDFCWGCSQKNRVMPKGENYGNFIHGISNQGYRRVTVDGVRQQEHKYIYGLSIGRKLENQEQVHHIDFNKLNNNIENLYLCKSLSENFKLNVSMQKCGFIFLNKRIWFDYKKKVYSLNKSNVPDIKEPVVLLPAYAKKLYVKKSRDTFYVMYLRKRHDWQRYHIAVMEAFIGRKFKKGEGVHHINGNTLDNSIRNLCLVTNAEHQNAHKSLLACAAELFRRGLLTFSNGEYKCG